MVFKKWNIIYPSKKIFNELKTIEKNIKPFYNPSPGGGPRLSEISCTYEPPIYDITSGFRVAALFSSQA